MIQKWLNNGIYPGNSESLNRKIRISNLIGGITIIVLMGYLPLFFLSQNLFDLCANFVFLGSAIANYFLLKKRKYIFTFIYFTVVGYCFMIWGGIFYGLQAHMHYFLIIMFMITAVLIDNKKFLYVFMTLAIVSFFGLEFIMKDRVGLIGNKPELVEIMKITSYTNLFVLFFVICVFIIFFKNDNLRYQQKVEEKNAIIEEKNKEMLDSINYAQRIQSGLLPSKEFIHELYPGSFLYFSPKDIVSGDFYWFYKKDNVTWIACGDCTGHGVPGALMSVLGINLLNEIVESNKAQEPAKILENLRAGIIKSLNKENKEEYKDGMDISLLKIEKGKNALIYAGANNPVYKISGNVLEEYKATKQPVGLSHEMKPFNQLEINYSQGDHIILFTDGFADQFGGKSNKKYMYKHFKEFLVKIVSENADGEKRLHAEFTNWRSNVEQIDDVCVIGVKL
jgi:sigma-B regulation protein RsbU (phosphoserine phosphatase)